MHDGRIQFDDAVFVGQPAEADAVIIGIVFNQANPGDNGLECVRALLDEFHRFGGGLQAVGTGDDNGFGLAGPSGLSGA